MKPSRPRGALSIPKILFAILAGSLILSLLFYAFWQRLNRKVEDILKEQFNQQQLELARKIADNVEAYFDYLENDLLAFPWRLRVLPPHSPDFEAYMEARFQDLHHLGILEIRLYDWSGRLQRSWRSSAEATTPEPAGQLSAAVLTWLNNPAHKGRLYLGEVHRATEPPWQGRLVMPFYTGLYGSPGAATPYGVLELLINPLFIANKVTTGVRSGATGYAWIVDQDGVLLAHYEKNFVGHHAIKVRQKRNPKLSFQELKGLQEKLLGGEEGTGEYVSGWHRQRLGAIPKLAAYVPVKFDKGLIKQVTDVQNPAHNLWGVAVVAPLAEVAGQINAVMHQELFIVALFFLVVILVTVALVLVALRWNRALAREVNLKTEELLESQERLVRSESFAAVGEAAAYVSHEIKNPLMVIGGLAAQVERTIEDGPAIKQKLQIIQNEVQRLENFLGDLRDFTRPTVPTKQKVDLNQIIQEVEALMQEQAQSQGITLREHLDPQLPPLEADPSQMKQVLLNLVKNSLEALNSGGQVTFSSGTEDHQVWFAVRDNGNGMPPEVLDKIFNPFFTTKEKGTGLGLAVIHKIVEDHNGEITVSSTPDKGTVIRVNLPG
jgi:two-component system, NtrC family, sensor histidine kinase HydH